MKTDMKEVLAQAFAAPEPKGKKEFLKKAGPPKISTFSFILLQISYIRKRVWAASVFISILAMMGAEHAGQDCIWVMSAMIPFIALCAVTENVRSSIFGMGELEMASMFSLKSVTLARLSGIGLLHFILLCILVLFVGKNASLPFMRAGVYLTVPYLLTSVLGFMIARRIRGKEVIYICMGISIMVSSLNFILKESLPGIYEEKRFAGWCITVVYLAVKMWSEGKKTMNQKEELAWN